MFIWFNNTMHKEIPFSPPDINENDIAAVIQTLESGWITTGAKCRDFAKVLAEYTNTKSANLFSSATSAMEMALRLYGITEGDEVITTPYTYAATSNLILHTGAKAVFVDVKKDSFSIDPKQIEAAINKKTKAIIPVDFGGQPVDYDEIKNIAEQKKALFKAKKDHDVQNSLGRTLLILDAAHSLGAKYNGKTIGSELDFTAFSFHAVKNLTTAEGGALVYNDLASIDTEFISKELSKWALHGQDKSAFEKTTAGWQYDINLIGYKCNMTDVSASLGLSQLLRYDKILEKRKAIFELYREMFSKYEEFILPPFNEAHKESSYHLFPLRIRDYEETDRDILIMQMKKLGISLNVHFKPVVMHTAYKNLGYDIKDFPNAYDMYKNEVSLPLYSKLDLNDAEFVAQSIINYCLK